MWLILMILIDILPVEGKLVGSWVAVGEKLVGSWVAAGGKVA